MSSSADRLTVLFGAHYRPLVRLASHLSPGADDPEQIVQDAYVRVLGRWGGGRDLERAETQLRQFVVRRSRRVSATSGAPAEPIAAELAALPRREREAVVLRLYADLTEAQAADAMGTSAAAVGHLTAAAVDRLHHLTESTEPPERAVRALLHERDTIDIRADGMVRIRERLRARRSRVLTPAAGLLGLVVLGAAGTYAVAATDDGPSPPRPRATGAPVPEPSECTGGLCIRYDPSPSPPDPTATVAAVAGAALVAVRDGRVVLADATTGETIRQLSKPEPGDVDSYPTRGATDGVVWVRTHPDGCSSSLLRTGLDHGASGVTLDVKPRRRRLPSLSAGGRVLAWVEGDCAPGTPDSVVVRGPDARFLATAESTAAVDTLDVRDDGTALVGVAGRSYLVRPGATSVRAGVPLRGAPGCAVVAPAWNGSVATAWQRCGGSSRLTRFDARGKAVSASVRTPGVVTRMAVAGGLVLVVRADGTPGRVIGGDVVPIPGGDSLADAAW